MQLLQRAHRMRKMLRGIIAHWRRVFKECGYIRHNHKTACMCVCVVLSVSCLCGRQFRNKPDSAGRKVLTYIEYRAVSGVFRTIDPPPPPPPTQRVCPPPARGGGYTLGGRWGGAGGGVNISEDSRLGLASYSKIPLRYRSSRAYSFLLPVVKYWFFFSCYLRHR